MELSVELEKWRDDRPDEWKMDEFIRNAAKLEQQNAALAAQVEALRIALAALSVQAESALQEDIVCYSALKRAQHEADEALAKTPQHHLAELRAEAVLDAVNFGRNQTKYFLRSSEDILQQIEQYAEQIRQEGK